MTPTRFLVTAVGTVAVVFGLLVMADRGCTGHATKHKQEADTQKGVAEAHAGEAQKEDAKVEAQALELERAKTAKDEALAKLAALRDEMRRRAELPAPGPAVPEHGPSPVPAAGPVEPGLGEVVARQDEVIRAQAEYITKLEGQVSTLTGARDHWKAAYEAEERRAVALELALKAKESAGNYRSAKWGLLGLAVGFAGGRL